MINYAMQKFFLRRVGWRFKTCDLTHSIKVKSLAIQDQETGKL